MRLKNEVKELQAEITQLKDKAVRVQNLQENSFSLNRSIDHGENSIHGTNFNCNNLQ